MNATKSFLPFEYSVDLSGVKLTSYMTYHKGILYVGYFDKTSNGVLAAYPMTEKGVPDEKNSDASGVLPQKTWPTYEKIQGISFDEDKIFLSQSYGTKNSKIFVFDNRLDEDNFDLDKGDAIASFDLPPYLEQIIARNDRIYLLFESASHKYRKNMNIFHMDRIIKIKIEDIYK